MITADLVRLNAESIGYVRVNAGRRGLTCVTTLFNKSAPTRRW